MTTHTAERITDALLGGEKIRKYTLSDLLCERYEPECATLIARIVSADMDELLAIQSEQRQICAPIVDAFLASPRGCDLVEDLAQAEQIA